jgi:cysteinyl-tRNA synthetase
MRNHNLRVYNTLSRTKEAFAPLDPPYVGMYVCGPTVYSNVHLGNVRTFLTFDVLYRYLRYLGYRVRYVRNITDVGHLESDADEGEDKIAKKARLERLEPMEIVQQYTNDFHEVLRRFNFLPPSVEPSATGHIVEQIETVKTLIENGFAYESGGSVYFDVLKYNQEHAYGKLSGRVVADLLSETRDLDGQAEKRNRWTLPSGKSGARTHHAVALSLGAGFPGWHIECTCMSTKYLGKHFDIHGGGMDLKFPHHECEIAQAVGAHGEDPVTYWMHTNMLTVNGEKMSKSKGNSFLPAQLFAGDHPLLLQAYSPMTVRFFMLQAHYRSTLDFSNDALIAARKGYKRLMNGLVIAKKMQYAPSDAAPDAKAQEEVKKLVEAVHAALDDDLNTAMAFAHLFSLLKLVNKIHAGSLAPAALGEETFNQLVGTFVGITGDVLGLVEEKTEDVDHLVEALLDLYREAKLNKAYDKIDQIRARLKAVGISVKDMKTGIEWAYEE